LPSGGERWPSSPWQRVARSYGRTVVWFRSPDDRPVPSYEIVRVGDAGTGRGWPDRMVELFREAVEAWTAHREANGWPT